MFGDGFLPAVCETFNILFFRHASNRLLDKKRPNGFKQRVQVYNKKRAHPVSWRIESL